jgi:hypothetical protein
MDVRSYHGEGDGLKEEAIGDKGGIAKERARLLQRPVDQRISSVHLSFDPSQEWLGSI